MKSVIDHLEIVSATAHKLVYYLVNISSAPNDYVAQARTEAELLRALANYCSEQADAAEDAIPRLLRVEQELQELTQQEQQERMKEPLPPDERLPEGGNDL